MQEMIGFWYSNDISWTICKQSAPCCRQTTTPTAHHSDALPDAQPTVGVVLHLLENFSACKVIANISAMTLIVYR